MIRMIKFAACTTASAAALLIAASSAQASSFAIRSGQGAEGLGMAYAGAASGGIGMASIAWNPATITMFPGRTSNYNFTYLKATADYQPTRGTSVFVNPPGVTVPFAAVGGRDGGTGNIGGNGSFIPASYTAWQLTDRLWVGVSTGAPFGLRSKPENQVYGGQTYGRSAKIRTINVAPTVGYKVNDWLSIGAAVQGQYIKARLSQAAGPTAAAALTPIATPAILEGDNFSWGYRLGATITPMAGTVIGLGYRSSIHHQISGSFDGVAPISLPVKMNLNLPDSVTFGISQQLNEQWQAHVGVEWTNWSRFRRLPIVNQLNGLPVTSLNFVYDDSWFFSTGLEYKMNSQLTLRAGVAYELSAVNDSNRTVFISDNDRLWLSAGASYKFTDKLTMDLGYTFIDVKKARIDYNVVTHPQWRGVNFQAEAKPQIHIASVGITYRWDDPKVAEPVRPVVRKF
jgi:long-chain fatty acid transport protein